ncbi:glutamate-ammonia-ligase adenylyltransferase [Sediminihabitans luteus]|uniref:Bifunctional glutamine synthetase adenylyltransferase/adenylyl-removing enzyme n=1 Tax=Sediminihabitans luteus TaxID=1138585 RepID=A0A2M9CQ85_9CELL|nr:bifunctional [glutamine synthetase] adenylyltransferase/[glutamine synthetase]-adenylyl-L-tyrosine phosphorylase [Sediminihabitans luteus]PJJ74005.1 glutamate-ammonia-ligase adenylyltransferase [Sediminihabitans luteus]GII98081.1 glutamate-ammonia-ligase adenylyltransferase [Sediminihabitans luteus]
MSAGSSRPGGGRSTTLVGRLSRLGFGDATRAAGLLADPALAPYVDAAPDEFVDALGWAPDPDLAVLQLVRLAEAATDDDAATLRGLVQAADDASRAGQDRLLAVLGSSVALGDEIVRHPALVHVLADPAPGTGVPVGDVRSELLRAVGADPDAPVPVAEPGGEDGTAAMRRAYRTRLLRIAATDLTSTEPLTRLPGVAAALADLAAAALEAALAVARAEVEGHEAARIAVLGMGKTGGRELNYVSDVDVIYVVEPAEGHTEEDALAVGTRLATHLAHVCSGTAPEPPLWPVDAALRPEGKQGPLVRTLASHVAYYERWAKTWEFQALLKARLVAGDAALGAAYREAVDPFVWQAVTRDNFVEDTQAMRRRVENHVPAAEADRQIKLGKGGLRDVEFTVQLLQLVHGRADAFIRSPNTLTALADLTAGGYVGRDHAARLAVCYRFLRSLEHRVQLFRLRRTHLVPTKVEEQRTLARSLGMRAEGAEGLMERWRATRREVRALHEEIYYRPLLPAMAQLTDDEVRLTPEAVKARFAAIGYRDPAGASRHVTALTEGVSRRAAIQRQLLPVMLGWFAEGADPDEGLLAFRKLSEELGTTPWYLKLLRDSGTAAERLALLLANSRYAAEAFTRTPEAVRWLADDAELEPRGPERLATETDAILTRAQDPDRATTLLRAVRRRELGRTAAAEILGVLDPVGAARAISDAADPVLVGGLRIAEHLAKVERDIDPREPGPARMLVVAMGRLGGQEMGYGSDADVLFVHDPADGVDDTTAQKYATSVATTFQKLLNGVGPEPALPVDADLRPEGRNGPLSRSLASYAEYYGRWSSAWESQALLRARPVAGDVDLGRRFVTLVDPLRYPEGGINTATVREIRRIKARVEAERLPRGVEPARHLKLGRGGVSDVEWTVQVLQLQHAHAVPALRTTATIAALRAAADAGLVDADDADVLAAAWHLASRLRSAVVLLTGRTGGRNADLLPHDHQLLGGLARLLDVDGNGSELEELYLRTTRRARAVVERVFYGED